MNISDEQLDRMIAEAKHDRNICVGVYDVPALLHILETYRDMPKTADGVMVVPGQKVWVITADDGIQEDEITSELCFYNAHPIDKTFSTREAAEAAKASGK